jgi:AbiV family abortive infection protein
MTDRDNYNKIYDNGLAHINSARILAESNHFGFAISHLILGIEELIKYQVVLVSGADPTLFEQEANLHGNKTVFKNHGTKHNLIKEFQESIAPGFGDTFVESVFYKASGQPLKPKHVEVQRNRFKEMGSFLGVAYREINIPIEERENFFKWLSQANNLKNKGFYVNLINGVCESPISINKEEFETAYGYAVAILKQTQVYKDLDITDDEFIDMLNTEVEVDEKMKERINKSFSKDL